VHFIFNFRFDFQPKVPIHETIVLLVVSLLSHVREAAIYSSLHEHFIFNFQFDVPVDHLLSLVLMPLHLP